MWLELTRGGDPSWGLCEGLTVPHCKRFASGRQRTSWVVHVANMSEKRNVYRVLVRKPERKRPLRIPRHRWEDDIKWI